MVDAYDSGSFYWCSRITVFGIKEGNSGENRFGSDLKLASY